MSSLKKFLVLLLLLTFSSIVEACTYPAYECDGGASCCTGGGCPKEICSDITCNWQTECTDTLVWRCSGQYDDDGDCILKQVLEEACYTKCVTESGTYYCGNNSCTPNTDDNDDDGDSDWQDQFNLCNCGDGYCQKGCENWAGQQYDETPDNCWEDCCVGNNPSPPPTLVSPENHAIIQYNGNLNERVPFSWKGVKDWGDDCVPGSTLLYRLAVTGVPNWDRSAIKDINVTSQWQNYADGIPPNPPFNYSTSLTYKEIFNNTRATRSECGYDYIWRVSASNYANNWWGNGYVATTSSLNRLHIIANDLVQNPPPDASFTDPVPNNPTFIETDEAISFSYEGTDSGSGDGVDFPNLYSIALYYQKPGSYNDYDGTLPNSKYFCDSGQKSKSQAISYGTVCDYISGESAYSFGCGGVGEWKIGPYATDSCLSYDMEDPVSVVVGEYDVDVVVIDTQGEDCASYAYWGNPLVTNSSVLLRDDYGHSYGPTLSNSEVSNPQMGGYIGREGASYFPDVKAVDEVEVLMSNPLYTLKCVNNFNASEGATRVNIARSSTLSDDCTKKAWIILGVEGSDIPNIPSLPWEVAIDGDIYAAAVNDIITFDETEFVTGGFSANLVNITQSDIPSYVRTIAYNYEDDISDDGGYMSNIGEESKDSWLGGFDYLERSKDELPEVSSLGDIEAGGIYKLSGNNLSGEYDVGDSVAILYADDDVLIDGDITTTGEGILMLVTPNTVTISSDVQTPFETFTVNSPANVKLGIIAKEGIDFESCTDCLNDEPVMVEGFVASPQAIVFDRSLNENVNTIYPAEAVRLYDKALPIIMDYMFETGDLFGLTTFDVDWFYEGVN